MKQQDQTKVFFKNNASQWQSKAIDQVYSVINDRHRAVHRTLSNYKKGSSILDIGCGTGQLAIEAAENGYKALGIDFAEEMIDQAIINKEKAKSSAEFQVESVFNFKPKQSYNVISAMGFIEYVSLDQLNVLLDFCYNNTTSNGSISIGSRNRLFNLTTFNDYTNIELKLGTINELIKESNICNNSGDRDTFLNTLREYVGSKNLIQNDTHPITTIGVETRYQFTPSDLMHRIEAFGFKVSNIFPVNFHAFQPAIIDPKLLSISKNIAELISVDEQTNFQLIPNSSSFVIEAQK